MDLSYPEIGIFELLLGSELGNLEDNIRVSPEGLTKLAHKHFINSGEWLLIIIIPDQIWARRKDHSLQIS